MTDQEFSSWGSRYCDAHQLNPEWMLGTLTEWRRIFETDSYTANELDAALKVLISSPPARDTRQHINRLMLALREARANERPPDVDRDHPMGICGICDSVGFVAVPHPKCISRNTGDYVPYRAGTNRATYYELAVYCRCALGKWFQNKQEAYFSVDRKGKPLDLERYERFNPDWSRQMEVRRREDDRLASAAMRSGPHWSDAKLAEIRDRVAALEGEGNREGDAA